jgi:hypothetical protein
MGIADVAAHRLGVMDITAVMIARHASDGHRRRGGRVTRG